jgi:hypothetical protein
LIVEISDFFRRSEQCFNPRALVMNDDDDDSVFVEAEDLTDEVVIEG